MAGRPEFTKGYLGAQSKFAEFGLSTVSHDSPEINLEGNEVCALIFVALYLNNKNMDFDLLK